MQLKLPDDMGVIIRTAGVGRDAEELQWDLDYLLQLWKAITEAAVEPLALPDLPGIASSSSAPCATTCATTSARSWSITEEALRGRARVHAAGDAAEPAQAQAVQGHGAAVHALPDRIQIENAFERTVRLPSGGSIVIDPTEALTAIDINSAKRHQGRRHRGNRVQHQPRSGRGNRAPDCACATWAAWS
jgi:ribonuclease E